jgi:hypothetical protein
MIEARRRPRLPDEADRQALVEGGARREDLERDAAIEAFLDRP